MGCYDTFGNLGIQLKCLECSMSHLKVGDDVNLADGLYVGYEGCVVISKRKFVAEIKLDSIFDKWGNQISIDIDNRNPIKILIRKLSKERTLPNKVEQNIGELHADS